MRRLDRVDWLLLLAAGLAVSMLVITLAWPAVESWWHRPRAGMQVAQQFLGTVGAEEYEKKIWVDYLLYLPEEYEDDKAWPLVVYLHGSGARGNDLEKVRRGGMPTLVEQKHDFPFVLVSPQCPEGARWEPERVLAMRESFTPGPTNDLGKYEKFVDEIQRESSNPLPSTGTVAN